jgi:hypothetical protein
MYKWQNIGKFVFTVFGFKLDYKVSGRLNYMKFMQPLSFMPVSPVIKKSKNKIITKMELCGRRKMLKFFLIFTIILLTDLSINIKYSKDVLNVC